MREKDEADAAHLFKRIHEIFDVARRIDQPIAVRDVAGNSCFRQTTQGS